MKNTIVTFAAVYALIIGGTSCNSSSTSAPTIAAPGAGTGASYIQVERLARPAVKEALQAYDNHEATARANPYSDPKLPGDIVSFMTGTAGRSAATANALQAVLIPDETVADLSQLGAGAKAGYLGVETGGQYGTKFGGRGLPDDVITADLSAIFGNLLSTIPALGLADDKKEIPCLTTDNVPASNQAQPTATFPYLNAPN